MKHSFVALYARAAFTLAILFLSVTHVLPLNAADPPALPACNRARFECLPAYAVELTGTKIEGSNVSRTEGFVTLVEIRDVMPTENWGEVRFENSKLYRGIRITLPRTSKAKIGKFELYAGDRLLAGEGKGASFRPFVDGQDAVDAFATGYDLFESATANRPGFNPAGGDLEQTTDVTLGGPREATIRYTLDGTLPTADHGEIYSSPIRIDKNTTISAVALQPDRAPSLPVTVTYLLRNATKPGLKSAHIGNSLTGTTGGFWRYARTAGYDHKSHLFLRPGALTRELWALASGDFANDKLASAKEAQTRQRKTPSWDDFWAKVGPIDLLTLQPRDFDLEREVAAEIAFIRHFRQKSPDLKPWLYCEWVEMNRQRPSDKGTVPSFQMQKTFPALTSLRER